MAKGSRGGRRSAGADGSASQSHIGVQVQQNNAGASGTGASAGAGGSGGAGGTYSTFDDNDAQKMRQTYDDKYNPDVTDSIKLYISDSNPNGDGYSHSQNLNYKLDNGKSLNATERFIDSNMQAGMHDIGKNTTLVKYAHDDILQQMGLSGYEKMSNSQLQKAVGTKMKTTSYMSTSYDSKKSPFSPNAPLGGGREVTINIKASSTTQVVFGAKKQAEMIVNKGTGLKVTGIHFDGTTAHPRGGGSKPRVILDVETF